MSVHQKVSASAASLPRFAGWVRAGIAFVVLGGLMALAVEVWTDRMLSAVVSERVLGDFQTFATLVTAISIEAIPFLLLGVLTSAVFSSFVDTRRLSRLLPSNRIAAMGVSSVAGLAFPICDCGLIPLGRGMMRRGMPSYAALTFMLAAPTVNPLVLWTTATAFGHRPEVVALRLGVALLVAWIVGLLLSTILRWQTFVDESAGHHGRSHVDGHQDVACHFPTTIVASGPTNALVKIRTALAGSIQEFLEMAAFLTIGAIVAAAIQVLIPRSTILDFASGPVLSVAVLMALRAVLSVCATVDALLALALAPTFGAGALVAFMTFGPVFDVKNLFMIGGSFNRRLLLLYLGVVTPLIFLAGVAVNLLLPSGRAFR